MSEYGERGELKSSGRLSPFYPHRADVARLLLMVHDAISKFDDVWLQPPHWDRPPTKEELAEERRLEERSIDADNEIKRLAGEIYYTLTGERVEK